MSRSERVSAKFSVLSAKWQPSGLALGTPNLELLLWQFLPLARATRWVVVVREAAPAFSTVIRQQRSALGTVFSGCLPIDDDDE